MIKDKVLANKGWLAACLALGLLAACDSSSGNGPGGGGALTEAALIGKWNVTSRQSKGWETDDEGNHKNVDTLETYPAGTSTVEYKSDKTFAASLGGLFSINGTWSIKGDSVITLTTIFGLTDTTSAYAVINGNEGTFTEHNVDSEQDLVVTTKATKQ
jgi:hypothetical protein